MIINSDNIITRLYDQNRFHWSGNNGFTRELVRDTLAFPLLENVQLALMDIDAERLDFAKCPVEKIIALGKYPATVTTTLERVEALRDTYVLSNCIIR